MATTPSSPGSLATADARASRRAIVAGSIGNFVEWYDFVLYGSSAPILAVVFFANTDPTAGLLATFATFGVAFLARPFGAVLLGNLGDRIGRRAVLAGVVITISIGTALIGLTPGYGSIGILAPVILVIIRALQGFTAGGEFGGSVAFIIEYAPAGKRGWYGSWQTATVALGSAAAALALVLVTSLLPEDAVVAWGWRIPFLVAFPIGLIGLFLRLRMEDTPDFRHAQELQDTTSAAPIVEVFRSHWRVVIIGALVVVGGTVSTYVFQNYVPAFLNTDGGVPLRVEQFGNMIGLVFYGVGAILWGRLSDRFGRKPFLIGGAIVLFALMWPLFQLARVGDSFSIALALSIFGFIAGAIMGILPVLLSDFFPTAVRMSGLSISYTIANALFGGTAPFVVTFLVASTMQSDAAVFYCMAAVVVTFVGALFIRRNHEVPQE